MEASELITIHNRIVGSGECFDLLWNGIAALWRFIVQRRMCPKNEPEMDWL